MQILHKVTYIWAVKLIRSDIGSGLIELLGNLGHLCRYALYSVPFLVIVCVR